MNEKLEEPALGPDQLAVIGDDAWMVDEPADNQATLQALHEVTRSLVDAADRTEVARLAVAAARNVLDLPLSGIHVARDDRLVPVAVTEEVAEAYGDVPSLAAGDHPAWRAYVDREPIVFGEHDVYRSVATPEPPAESGVLAPLGEHGVFLMNTPEERRFSDDELSFAFTLAANTRTALEAARREAALAEQNERLETFAAMLSHDLRNPLTMLEGNLELARKTGEDRYFEKAEEAADRMDELIDEVFVLAQSGVAVEETEWIDPERVVHDAWAECPTDAGTLHVELPGTVRIAADPNRLRQLLGNLLDNALEHGGTDPTVTVDLDGDVLSVADDGPGIPPEDRASVFDYGFTASEDGTGLGLRIVAELAEAHDWSVAVEESEAGGTRIELHGVETRDISG